MSRKKHNQPVDEGKLFEEALEQFLNVWLHDNHIKGLCYLFPDGGDQAQRIDLLLDSEEIGNIGIECKSIFENAESFKTGKIEIAKFNRIGKDGIGQLERQHGFLKDTGRYGVLAIEFRCSQEVYLVPHETFFNKLAEGDNIITFDEVIKCAYRIGSDGDLSLFLKNKCGII